MFFSSCSSMMAVYPNDGGGMTVATVSQKELNGPPNHSSMSSKNSESKYKQMGIIPPPPGFLPASSHNGSANSNTGPTMMMNTSGSLRTFAPATTGLKKSAQSFTSQSQLKSQMASEQMPVITNNASHYHNNYNNHVHSKHLGHTGNGKHGLYQTAGGVVAIGASDMTHVSAHLNNLHHHNSTTGSSAVVHPGHMTGGQQQHHQVHCHPPLPYQILQQQQSQHHHCTSCHKQNGVTVTMKETKKGLSRVQKLKKRLSRSFGRLAISKDEDDVGNKFRCNGYSDEFLDRIEPNGNILRAKQHSSTSDARIDWPQTNGCGGDEMMPPVTRQLSVSSDSKLLDDDHHHHHHHHHHHTDKDDQEEPQVILRQNKRPPRPKSEVFLSKEHRRSKRYSAFGGDSPFGKSEAYIKLEQLGEGSYATVFKGYSNLTNQVVALKEIRLQEEEGTPFTAIREASLLKDLKHANIVILHDIVHTRSTLTFVFEYLHTDLSQYLERHPGGLNPKNVKLFLFQLLRGLAFCHRRRILHRDVKPQNLLLSQSGELKLADFGLARAKSVPSHTYSHEVVTLWYRPPDVLLGSTDYSTSLDTWGVGCIFVEMLTGAPVFPGVRDVSDQLDKIFRILGTPTEKTWEGVTQLQNYSREVKRIYKSQRLGLAFPRLYDVSHAETLAAAFLVLDPTKRLEANEALNHKYFSDLPPKTYELPHESSIYTVDGIKLYPEDNHRRSLPKTGSYDFRRKI